MPMQKGPNESLFSTDSRLTEQFDNVIAEQFDIDESALSLEGITTLFQGAEEKRTDSADRPTVSPLTHESASQTSLASGTSCSSESSFTHWAASLAGPEDFEKNQNLVNPRTKQPPLVRPLSAYNFFFQFERSRLLQHDDIGDTTDESGPLPLECLAHYKLTVDNSSDFQQHLLKQQWSRDPTVKRKHVKSHGRISFSDLSKRISAGWRQLPTTAKEVFYEIARTDLQRFTREKKLHAAQDSTQPLP
jgi:HMG-box domain